MISTPSTTTTTTTTTTGIIWWRLPRQSLSRTNVRSFGVWRGVLSRLVFLCLLLLLSLSHILSYPSSLSLSLSLTHIPSYPSYPSSLSLSLSLSHILSYPSSHIHTYPILSYPSSLSLYLSSYPMPCHPSPISNGFQFIFHSCQVFLRSHHACQ